MSLNHLHLLTLVTVSALCLIKCSAQTPLPQYGLYIDSKAGSDYYSGTENAPLSTLQFAFTKAQRQGPVNATFHLVPNGESYSMPGIAIRGNKLPIVNIQTKIQNLMSNGRASVIVSGIVPYNQVNMTLTQVEITNYPSSSDSQMFFQSGSLKIVNSSVNHQPSAGYSSPLFNVNNGSVAIECSVIQFVPDSKFLEANDSIVNLRNTSITCACNDGLSNNLFIFSNCDLNIFKLNFTGSQLAPSRSLDSMNVESAILNLNNTRLTIQSAAYSSPGEIPIKFITGSLIKSNAIDDFAITNSNISSPIIEFWVNDTESLSSVNISRLSITENLLPQGSRWNQQCPGIICFVPFQNLSLAISNITIQNNTKQDYVTGISVPIFHIEGQQLNVAIRQLTLANNTISNTLINLYGQLDEFTLENVDIRHNTLDSNVINLAFSHGNEFDNKKTLTIKTVNFISNLVRDAQFLNLQKIAIEPEISTGIPLNYLEIDSLVVMSNNFQDIEQRNIERPSFISCNDFGIRLFDSVFSDNFFNIASFISLTNQMVTVVIANSTFHCTNQQQCVTTAFFSHKEMNFNDKLVFDPDRPERIVPNYESFCLLNNKFTVDWGIFDVDSLFRLNVANFFIHGNKFINASIQGQTLFEVSNIIPAIVPRAQTMYILLSEDEKSIIDPFLTDPLLLSLFQQAIFENSKIDPKTSISCVFSFSGNQFEETAIVLDNLLKIGSPLSNTLIDVSNNVFSALRGTTMNSESGFIDIISAEKMPYMYVRNNTLKENAAPLLFLNIGDGVNSYTELLIHNNTLKENQNTNFLSLETRRVLFVNISENTVANSTIRQASALRLAFKDGEPSVNIFGNNFTRLDILAEGVTQVNVIEFQAQKETKAPVLIEKNSFIQNNVIPKRLNPTVLGYKNALVYLFHPESAVRLKNNTFLKNGAGSSTLFLAIYSQNITLDQLNFEHQNQELIGAGSTQTLSIYVATQNLTVINSHFEDNSARVGGALSIDYLISAQTTNNVDLVSSNRTVRPSLFMNITNNTFLWNKAELKGGAIYIEDLSHTAIFGEINGNYFGGNVARFGASIYIQNSLVISLTLAYNRFDCFTPMFFPGQLTGSALYLAKLPLYEYEVNQTISVLHSTVTLYDNPLLDMSVFDFSEVNMDAISMQHLVFVPGPKTYRQIPLTTLVKVSDATVRIWAVTVTELSSRIPLILLDEGAEFSMENSTFSYLNFTGDGCVISIIQAQNIELINSKIMNVTCKSDTDSESSKSPIYISGYFKTFLIKDSHFIDNNNASFGGVIFATIKATESSVSKGKIQIYNSEFSSNFAKSGGGAIYQYSGGLEIINSSFSDNRGGKLAGAVYIHDPAKLEIRSTIFESNSLSSTQEFILYGGALYLELFQGSQGSETSELLIRSNNFTGNRAGDQENSNIRGVGSGGAIFFHFHEEIDPESVLYSSIFKITKENWFSQNYAMNGPDYSTNPYYGSFVGLNSKGDTMLTCLETPCQLKIQAWADIFHHSFLKIDFIDFFDVPLVKGSFGGLFPMQSNFKMSLHVTNQSQIYSESNCSEFNCRLNGNDLSIKGFANQSINLTFKVSNPMYQDIDFVLIAKIRSCQVGEINDTKQLVCIPCDRGTYSVNLLDQTCHRCPQNAECPGGWKVNPLPGYWKPSLQSANIYKCNRSESCNYAQYGEGICSTGYKGPFCLACDLDNGYASSGTECAKCPAFWRGMLILVSIQIAIFIFEIWYIWYSRKINNSMIVGERYSRQSVDRLSRGVYLGIMIDYLQVIAILKNYPLLVSGFLIGLAHLGGPTQTLFFSSDCVFLQLGFSSESLFYTKLTAITILPFLKTGLCLLFGFAKKFIYSDYQFGTYLIVAVQCIILIELPSMVSTLASTLLCKSHDPLANDQSSVEHYLSDNPNVSCIAPIYYQYRNLLVVPLLVFWGAGYPLLLLAILISKRKKLQTHKLATKFGTQYVIYRSKYYYWNLVQLTQKLILIFFAQISFLSLKMIGLTLFLILFGYSLIIKKVKPYRSVDLQKTYIRSLYVFLFTIFLAVYGYEEENLNGVISTAIIVINGVFIAYIVIKILHLFGFQCITRLINRCIHRISGNSEEQKKNYFFDETYNNRKESVTSYKSSLIIFEQIGINEEAEKTRASQVQTEKTLF